MTTAPATPVRTLEQRPAFAPTRSGVVERDGVRLAWEVHGSGPVTVLLMPTWSLAHSRVWKGQVGYLARHHRVVLFDGRGSGASDRPAGAAAYTDEEYAADALAVMDATSTPAAVLVGWSCGVSWSLRVAAARPERVQAVVGIAPACGLGVAAPARDRWAWDERHPTTEGWASYNRVHWLEDGLEGFRRFFFDQLFSEPHSTKQVEDGMTWSADVSAQVLADTVDGRLGLLGAETEPLDRVLPRVRCPVTVVHGTDDRVRPLAYGQRLADLVDGALVEVEGAGHGLPGRQPVLVGTLVREVADQVAAQVVPPPPRRTRVPWSPARPRRILYLSSPIGLGHAWRDVAIVRALREQRPGLEVDWLAQDPVTRVLADAGERVHPASHWLASESAHVEHEAGEHDLHAFGAIRRMDEVLVHNYLVFDEVVRERDYDLVVGDEAWDVDHFLHENPERKRAPFAWMTDFVGWLPLPEGGEEEVRLTADHNEEMLEHRARFPWVRDRSVFVGDPEDVVGDAFGPGLPGIREWTEQQFSFAGYVTGFDVPDPAARRALRASLGYRPEHRLCVVTVGGTGVGEALLRRVLDAVPLARRACPELRFLVVAGPRVDRTSLPEPDGTRVVGYLPRLAEHLAACDLAVVQGGLTTCMELVAAGTPFVYVPLERHFEQQRHVRHRLQRYGAGRHLAYADACDPGRLAAALLDELDEPTVPAPVAAGGASRAASLLADLL